MPASETIALDQALARAGENIIVRRIVDGSLVDLPCRAVVRGVTQEKVIGTILATDLEVIISPTEILAANWPSNPTIVSGQADPRIPRITDFVVAKGKQRQVKFSDPIFVGNEWVRCNLLVAG